MAVEDQSMLGIFGMTVYELMAAEEYARALITDEHTVRAMKEFTDASPKADAFKSDAIRGTGAWKSDAGTMLMTSIFLDDPKKLDSFKLLLDQMLIKPPVYRDLADWWLFFAALEAATGFQLETCVGRKREGGLTTHLLEALGTQGKIWSAYIAEPVKRAGATLSISASLSTLTEKPSNQVLRSARMTTASFRSSSKRSVTHGRRRISRNRIPSVGRSTHC
jgi:hypothetical protein